MWQPSDMEEPDCNSATLSIPTVQKSNEGSLDCVIRNTMNSTTVKLGKSLHIDVLLVYLRSQLVCFLLLLHV